MRKMTKLMSALMMAAALTASCEVASIDKDAEVSKIKSVSFSAGEVETRTAFSPTATDTSIPVLWTNNQKVRIFPNVFGNGIISAVTPQLKGKIAKFGGSIEMAASAQSAFYLLSPASCFSRIPVVREHKVEITVPATQTPTSTSPDEAAMILTAKTETYTTIPETVYFEPVHLTSYMAIMLNDIKSVGNNPVLEITAPSGVYLSGTVQYDYDTEQTAPVSGSVSNKVTAAVPSGSNPCFIACLPAKVSNKTLQLKVTGTAGSLTRSITVPSGKNLTAGKVATLIVDMDPAVSVTGVTVSPTTLSLTAGQTGSLTATVSPSNATNKTVTWSSSNTNVATVSSTGVVTAMAAGTATITATTQDGGKTATCAVTVTAATILVEDITLNTNYLELRMGSSSTLTATVTPANATNKTINWSSSDATVATVTPSGVVKGIKPGSATIYATAADGSGCMRSCSVDVIKYPTKVEYSFRVQPRDVDYQYDADEDVFHICKSSSTLLYYRIYYSDETTATTGATLSIVSGSGIEVSGNSLTCREAGKTAVIRLTTKEDESVYSDLTVKTWDKATSIKIAQQTDLSVSRKGILGWIKENTTSRIIMTVEPSTARQKIVAFKKENDTGWTVTQTADLQFTIKAPNVNGSSVSDYTGKKMSVRFICQTGNPEMTYEFTPTNIDLTQPKPLDYVSYCTGTGVYCITDGGMRIYIKGADGYSCKDLYAVSKPYTVDHAYPAGNPFVAVAVVTGFYPGQIPKKTVTGAGFPIVHYEYNDGCDNTLHVTLESGVFHGFAIALRNCADTYWSANNGDVPSSEHWNSSLGTIYYPRNAQNLNAFDLTVLAAYHNGALESKWCIYPVDRTWNYPDVGFEYTVSAWPSSVASYKMRPWVTPTVANFWMIRDATGIYKAAGSEVTYQGGKYTGGNIVTQLNERLTNAGGNAIFGSIGENYWTINMSNSTHAMMVTSSIPNNGEALTSDEAKQEVHHFRPFMVF